MLHDGSALHHRFPGCADGPGHLRSGVAAARLLRRPDRPRASTSSIAYFLALKGRTPDGEREFRRRFDLMALQRNLKALGTFGYQTIDAPQPGLHPVHAAHAALRAHEPREIPALRAASRPAGRAHRGAAMNCYGLTSSSRSRDRRIGWFRCGQNAQFGVSTHLYHGQRLTRDHLLEIAAHRVRGGRALRDAHAFRLSQPGGGRRPAAVAGRSRARAARRARADRRELHRPTDGGRR